MKQPQGLLDRDGRAGKIGAFLKVRDNLLKEFAYPGPGAAFPPESGVTSTCYALASPGDIIQINLVANKGTADVVDVEVDGIIRSSVPVVYTKSGTANLHIRKVLHSGKKTFSQEKREVAKLFDMVVKGRNTSQGLRLGANRYSAVGSIVLKCWRKNTRSTETESNAEKPEGPPTYESHIHWWEVNRHIRIVGPPPPFEIQFINGTRVKKVKSGPIVKERVEGISSRNPEEYELFCEFVFHLRSSADLISLGFLDVPIRYAEDSRCPKEKSTSKPHKSQKALEFAGLFDDEDEEDDPAEITTLKSVPRSKHQKLQPKADEVAETPAKSKLPKRPVEYKPQATLQSLLASMASGSEETPRAVEAESELNLANQPSEANDNSESSSIVERGSRCAQVAPDTIIPGDISVANVTHTISENIPDKVTVQERAVTKATQKLFVPGLKSAPAYQAWLKRGPARDEESQLSTPGKNLYPVHGDDFDNGQHDFSNSQHPLSRDNCVASTSKSHDHFVSSSPSHGDRDEARFTRSQVSKSESHNELNPDSFGHTLKEENSGSEVTIKRSPSETPSDRTHVASEVDIHEMVRRSRRFPGMTPENSGRRFSLQAQSCSTMGSVYHTVASPILGSSFVAPSPETRSPTTSFRIRTRARSESPPGLDAMQAGIHWGQRGDARISHSLILSLDKSSQKQRGALPNGRLSHWNEPARNKQGSFAPFQNDLSGNLSQKRKVDEANEGLPLHEELARKTNKPPHERKTAEVQASMAQRASATKIKADPFTETSADYSDLSAKKMSASELAKASMTTGELKKPVLAKYGSITTTPESNTIPQVIGKKEVTTNAARSVSRVTSDRVLFPAAAMIPITPNELSARKKAFQERLAAAAKRKAELNNELENAQVLKKQLIEIQEIEKLASQAERENEELQAQIEAIYGDVHRA